MKQVIAPLRDFLHRETSSGILILLASAVGLVIANSPISDRYFSSLDWQFQIGAAELALKFSVLKFINYVLMTLFFFVVGLEIKRELTSGHLASLKRAVMPFIAAIGGMALPALIYLAIAGDVDANGWGVPVATDIALAVGLLAMVGPSVAQSLRSFLLALAVIDDIGAIAIIAFVYSTGVEYSWALIGVFVILWIVLLKKLDSHTMYIYVILGIALWYCLLRSGVHPTLAGVILGLLTPNVPHQNSQLEDREDGTVSVIEWLEKIIHPWSSFVIVPIFAFANTGVEISNESVRSAINSPIAWGIFFGLVLGKPIGILLTSLAAKKFKIGEMPEGAKNIDLVATGSAAGIGFTVAIFIANLAFDDAQTQDLAVFSVIVASVVSGLTSYVIFKFMGRKVSR
ncbi:MAG: Na+/H+ antiporter NhaA [Candidatus Nanopelagicaceae bacterium]|nr:Na+/H+ antiporter NhaA [Candidatus Nanopelagicaceae bacterium]